MSALNQSSSSGHTAAFLKSNKATRCGPLATAGNSGALPLAPQSDATDTKRRIVVKFRLTAPEVIKLHQMLPPNGKSRRGISKFVRDRLFSPRRKAPAEAANYRLLASIKNELHQIARLANGIENPHTIVEVLTRLVSLDREIRKIILAAGTKGFQ